MPLVYFFLYGAVGALTPFLSLYYKQLGLSGSELSILTALSPFLLFLSQPIFGPLTDRSGHRGKMLGYLLVVVAVTGGAMAMGATFWTMLPLVALWAFFVGPLVPIADSIALGEVVRTGTSYPRFRLWGSIGFLLVSWLTGRLYGTINLRWMFLFYAGLMLVTLIFSRRLPAEGVSGKREIWPALKGLLRNRQMLAFLVLSSVAWMTQAAHAAFYSVHLQNIGGDTGMVGLAWALAAAVEVPVWLVLSSVTRRTGPWPVLALASFVYGLRWWIYSVTTVPSALVGLQVLQGLSFALFQPTAVTLVGELAGAELRTSGQALLVLVQGGLATIIGSLVAGQIVDQSGTAVLYRVCAYVAWVAFGGFLALMLARRVRAKSRTSTAVEG